MAGAAIERQCHFLGFRIKFGFAAKLQIVRTTEVREVERAGALILRVRVNQMVRA